MSVELAALTQKLNDAASYVDVFGKDEKALAKNYRKMARALHPDGKNAIDQQLASNAFVKLQSFYEQAQKATAEGHYGQAPKVIITSRKYTHEVRDTIGYGDKTKLFRCTSDETATVLKMATRSSNNDLLEQEASALRKIRASDDIEKFHPYFPQLIDTFKHNDLRANVVNYLDGFYSLAQVREAYGPELHPLDAVWMWRRLLVAIGAAHEAGIIHCAVLPDHVMIHPELHGLVLVDWGYSRTEGQKPLAMSKRWSDLYPEEFREEVGPGTDIYMAAATMMYLNGDNMPAPFRAFMRGCMLDRIKMRPQKAHDLLREYDELLERIGKPYHPRRFREFRMQRQE